MLLTAPGRVSRHLDRVVYGLNISGLDRVVELPFESDWMSTEALTVRVSLERGDLLPIRPIDAHRVVETFGGSHQWVLDRVEHTARLIGPPLDLDLLAHPCLAPVATAFNRWAGRESFHAASFALGGRGYGVIGAREAGKSTLMAGLAARGVTVMSDDLVITDGDVVFSGPRCLDLRRPFPGLELVAVSARLGTRLRVHLPVAPPVVGLGGWVFLGWGTSPSLVRCPPRQVLARLARWRGRQGLPSDPRLLLDLAALPAWTLTRPAAWSAYDETLDLLVAGIHSHQERQSA